MAVLASSERSRRRAAASASAEDPGACSAWRGDTPPQSSLPVNADGSVDYSSIDASPISKVLTRTIRGLLVAEVGKDTDPRPWDNFDAVLTSVREVNDMNGTARDVTVRAKRVFAGILPALYIGWVPPMWKERHPKSRAAVGQQLRVRPGVHHFVPVAHGTHGGHRSRRRPVPEALRKAFGFLPETVKVPQAIKAERCRFLEQSGCASVCVNSCKAPSQEWLGEDFGMDLHIQPNYDDFSCQWKFDVKPPPLYEDAAVMVPCFTNCPSEFKGEKDAWRQAARVASGWASRAESTRTPARPWRPARARGQGGGQGGRRVHEGAGMATDGSRGVGGGVHRPRGDSEEGRQVLVRLSRGRAR